MFRSTRHRQDKRPIDRMSESEVKSKLLLSDKTLAELDHAFKTGAPTLFTQEDYDKMKDANTRMRKRLDDIAASRLTSSLAGMSVRPSVNGSVNGTTKPGLEQRRTSGDATQLLSTSNPTRSAFIQPPSVPRVHMLDSDQSIQIQNAANEADRQARQAGLAHLPRPKGQRTRRNGPSQPNMGAYLPTGAFDVESDADDWMYEDEDSEFELELPELLRKQQREAEARESDTYSEAGSEGEYGDMSHIIKVDMEKMTDLQGKDMERASDNMQTS